MLFRSQGGQLLAQRRGAIANYEQAAFQYQATVLKAFQEVADTLDLIESLQAEWVIPGHGAMFNQVDVALSNARKKLDGFVQNPEKHARYGAKVLLKYKMLELHQVQKPDFMTWATNIRYIQALHTMHASDMRIDEWVEELLLDLERSKALTFQEASIVNL